LKSKIEVLGEVLKKHVNSLRAADSRQVSYCAALVTKLYFLKKKKKDNYLCFSEIIALTAEKILVVLHLN